MAVFTQHAPEHDVLIVADESEVFGRIFPIAPRRRGQWRERRASGRTLHAAHEQWGATQLHTRFISSPSVT